MADASIQIPVKKRRWPLWLILAALAAGLAATQVLSLRVALLRVLLLNGPEPSRDWAERQLVAAGPAGAPVFIEQVLLWYGKINSGDWPEAFDEIELAFDRFESCLEDQPESVLQVLPIVESQVPIRLRPLFYSNAFHNLTNALDGARLNIEDLSPEPLTRMAIALYENPLPRPFSDFGMSDSTEHLAQALRFGVPFSALEEVLARHLSSPTFDGKSELLDSINYAMSEYSADISRSDTSKLVSALIQCVDEAPRSLAVSAAEILLYLNHQDFWLPLLLAIASRPQEVLEFTANVSHTDASKFIDPTIPDDMEEQGLKPSSELGFGPISSIHFEFNQPTHFDQRSFIKGLYRHQEAQSFDYILWSWASLASTKIFPRWEPELATALSKAKDYQRPAILFVLAHCSPIYEWIRQDIQRSLDSDSFDLRLAATYASGFAIGSEGERLATALKAIQSPQSEMRRAAILGLWNFSPQARAQLFEAAIVHFCQSSIGWRTGEIVQLVYAVLDDEISSTARARESILGVLGRLTPKWIEVFAPLFQRHGRPEEREALVAGRWRHFNAQRPSLDFVEALFEDIPENQRQQVIPAPHSKDFEIEVNRLENIDGEQALKLARLSLKGLVSQPVTQRTLDTLTNWHFAKSNASALCAILSHGNDSEARLALSLLNSLADFTDEASEGEGAEPGGATAIGALARDSCPERSRVVLELFSTKLGLQRFQAAVLQDRSLARLLRPSPRLIEGWRTDSELARWLAELLAREALSGSKALWPELFGTDLDQAPELRALVMGHLAKAGGAPESRALIRASLSPEPPAKVIAELLSDPGLMIFDSPDFPQESRESRLAIFLNALTEEAWPRGRQCLSPEEAEDLRRFVRPPETPGDQIRLSLLARSAPALWTELAAQILNPEYKDRWSPAILQCARTQLSRAAFLAKSLDPSLFAQFLKSESATDSWLVLAERPELAAPLRAELEAFAKQELADEMKTLARAVLAQSGCDWAELGLDEICGIVANWPGAALPDWQRELGLQRILCSDELELRVKVAKSLRGEPLPERLKLLRDRALALDSRTWFEPGDDD